VLVGVSLIMTITNILYLVLIPLALLVTADIARRRQGFALFSSGSAVIYVALLLASPIVLFFGYAGGAWIGIAATSIFEVVTDGPKWRQIFGVVGIFAFSYFLGFAAILAGALLAKLAQRRSAAVDDRHERSGIP
jgi:hypothetical protein